ncbi:hypothetical protein PLICRDRAFT_38472 [Plicaturopsis crispa FD-325 SS-3]|nr:hypothetical protein PLICRDRAFT_38472 [Plicaturopsis crispa FD-325 SS-3]
MADLSKPSSPPRPRTREIIDPGLPLLEANRHRIQSVESKTSTYGSTEAHKIDIYYPPEVAKTVDRKPPILVFFYGGGFVRGARSSPPQHLVYNNVGAFFANRGLLTAVADYRLAPSATYPGSSEDVRDALLWVIEHPSEGDTSRLFVMAHSAGGVHVAGLLLSPSLFVPPLKQSLRGVVLVGVPYELLDGRRPEARARAATYYGSAGKVKGNQPLALLRRAADTHISTLPPVQTVLGESERRPVKSASRAFAQLFRSKGGTICEVVLPEHDHMSPILALSSGSGEQWGEDVILWIESR